MNLKVNTSDLAEDKGIVYLLQIDLEDKQLIKIGVTARNKVEDRVCEILTSIWKRYRIYPRCYVKRYRKTDKIFEKESILHKHFDEYRHTTEYVFSGSTEIFLCDLDVVVEAYEKVLKGEPLDEPSSEDTA